MTPIPGETATADEMRAEIAWLRRHNHALTLRLARALEEERKQLARELHDELGQSLTAIKTDAVLISNRSRDTDLSAHVSAQAILDTVSRIYEVVYSMMRRLRPDVLDQLGLGPALEALIAERRKQHPWVRCEINLAQDLSGLDDLLNITAYRAVQESLTNVARYSAATRVGVTVARATTVRGEQLHVMIADNGRGMDIKETFPFSGQFGLRGLAERVVALGGQLEFDSRPGHGTKVSVWLPVARSNTNDE